MDSVLVTMVFIRVIIAVFSHLRLRIFIALDYWSLAGFVATRTGKPYLACSLLSCPVVAFVNCI
jgi:hypothetical protein